MTRRNIMLGTAGHVDHGKSALVKLLTGCETDTLAEEKQRGLTIDLGFAPCRLADQRVVGIVDVPGHVDFIRNMVAGAQGIDVVIFVVAADDGIMPQTHEHLHILTLMGLRHGVVALTKIDLVDAARRDAVMADLRRLLAPTFLAGAPICPLSNISGEGLDGFFESLNQVVASCSDRPCGGFFRLWTEDAFPIRGSGTVVTGIPTHGRVRPGSRIQLLPGGLTGHVRRMQVYGEDAQEGLAGECVALNIPELEHETVRRGMVVCEACGAGESTMAEANLRLLESVKERVKDYAEVQFHVGTASVAANIAMLETSEMTGGQEQLVQVRLATPLPLVAGERFVVRANVSGQAGTTSASSQMQNPGVGGLTTIGGGQILGLANKRLRRKKQWTLDRLAARREAIADPVRWCEAMVRESEQPATAASLQLSCWNRPEEIAGVLARLGAEKRVAQVAGGGWLHTEVLQSAGEKLLAAIKDFHAKNPQRAGVSLAEIPGVTGVKVGIAAAAADLLVESKQLERRGELLSQAGSRARLPEEDQRLCDRLAADLQQGKWAPPSLEDLSSRLNVPPARVLALARLLAERGVIVRLDDRIWLHGDALEAAKQVALRLFRQAAGFSTMDFRDALGVSRKYAVPLVDYLDKIRFTVRSGNNRTPGVEAKKLLQP